MDDDAGSTAARAPSMRSEEPDRVLGAATAEQVLLEWKQFVNAASKTWREREAHPAEWLRLGAEAPRARESPSTEDDVEGLNSSPASCAVGVLAAAVRQARVCVAAGPALLQPLALFGDGYKLDKGHMDPQLIVGLAELLPTLKQVQQHLERTAVVAVHLVQQLIGLHEAATARDGCVPCFEPSLVLEALGELLAVPAVIDKLLSENPHFSPAHSTLSWIVRKASGAQEAGQPRKLEMPEEAAAQLSEQLREVETLVQGNAFELCLSRAASNFNPERPHGALREQVLVYLRRRMQESEATSRLLLPGEALVPWVCTFVLFARIWRPGRSELRLLTEVVKMSRKAPAVVVYGRSAWCAGEFLATHLSLDAGLKKEVEELETLRQRQAVRGDDGSFLQEMQKNRANVQLWLASLNAADRALASGNVSRALKDAQAALIRGLGLALRIRSTLEEFLVLHLREGEVLRSCLQGISLGFQLLKAIQSGPSAPRWAELSVLLQRHLAIRVHSELEDASSKRGAHKELLQLAVRAVYGIVDGAAPEGHLDVGALALCCAGQAELAASARWREFHIIAAWERHLARCCDTSWCYWARELLPELLADLWGRPRGMAGLPGLCQAFAAAHSLVPPDSELGRKYAQELRRAVDSAILSPLCEAIDEDLRLHTHAVMHSVAEGLPKVAAPRADVLQLLSLRPLRLAPGVVVDLADAVELRLSATFYDLTALAPQLAETYERMRSLARGRYGLKLLDGRLPSGSLDHSLDVIEVMRNVHQFSTQYSYSLHQQLFVQSANQGLAKVRAITIEHMATSIQMHGGGVINTMVSYIYGFLKRKFEVVVEFLGDESVKSRMLTDRQWFLERRGYSWARAVETARFIRRLGVSKDGVAFLDKLRQVVTQIGNSLGYVRMVRTAGMRCIAGSLPYVDACKAEEELPQHAPLLREAAEVTDRTLSSVRRCFDASTDYLHVLAEVFAKALGSLTRPSDSASAARAVGLFHVLVPALTESFLHALVVSREALAKRAVTTATSLRTNAAFVDDGFALGLAWLLRILGLEREFQALHWFEAEVAEQEEASQPASLRRELLQREMSRLAATFEAASELFGSVDVKSAAGAADSGAGPEGGSTDAAEKELGQQGA